MSLNQFQEEIHNHEADVHLVSQGHNITLGIEQKQRRPFSNCNIPLQFSQNYDIQFQLKNISRQVEKFSYKGKHMMQTTFFSNSSSILQPNISSFSQNQGFNFRVNSNSNNFNETKFHPNGRKYRHQVERSLQDSQKEEKTKHISDQEPTQIDQHKKYKKGQNNLDMPITQSYYIYFQDNKINKQKEAGIKVVPPQFKQTQVQKNNRQKTNTLKNSFLNIQRRKIQEGESDQGRTPPMQAFSKLQPQAKWVLQRKVKRLQKQLNQLKKKQQQRQKVKNFAYSHPKKDSKVQVGKQVQQLIDSLWP